MFVRTYSLGKLKFPCPSALCTKPLARFDWVVDPHTRPSGDAAYKLHRVGRTRLQSMKRAADPAVHAFLHI